MSLHLPYCRSSLVVFCIIFYIISFHVGNIQKLQIETDSSMFIYCRSSANNTSLHALFVFDAQTSCATIYRLHLVVLHTCLLHFSHCRGRLVVDPRKQNMLVFVDRLVDRLGLKTSSYSLLISQEGCLFVFSLIMFSYQCRMTNRVQLLGFPAQRSHSPLPGTSQRRAEQNKCRAHR